MGKYIGPKNKIARRFGLNLGLKTNPAKVARRLSQMPGVHGPSKKAGVGLTGYGKQLLEKQKAKLIYGLRERQFQRYVKEATRQKGDSGQHLLRLLEMRFDNAIYRMGFAVTRSQARQMVNHQMFLLNGKRMDIPSHIVKPGDVVVLKENKAKKKLFDGISEKLAKVELPSWISVDPAQKSGKILGLPKTEDFERSFDVKLIIEYYSTR